MQLLRRRLTIKKGVDNDVLVHAGPGAGKTLGALMGFKKMKEEGRLSKSLVFSHRKTIKRQWFQAASLVGLKFIDWEDDLKEGKSFENTDGLLVTYQSASRNYLALFDYIRNFNSDGLIAIADEAHHLGVNPEEPDGPVWGRTFLELTKNFKLRLGLTGTPFRADNLAFCSGKRVCIQFGEEMVEQITPDLCVEPKELIQSGDVRPLEFRFQDGCVKHRKEGSSQTEFSALSAETREQWRARNLRRAIKLSDSSSIALQIIIRAKSRLNKVRIRHCNAAGLVIAKDIDHAISISNFLKEQGDEVDLVHSQELNACEKLARFQNGKADWLVSVDMCSEGFDAPRIRVVAYLTTVVTKTRFLQGVTRAVRMSSERSSLELIPREPSYIFSPADPLLIGFARNWSITNPYLIKGFERFDIENFNNANSSSLSLPLEAVHDAAGAMIKLRRAELPGFL
ncbi:DEAD/DEAH box helicase [Prochlorococcus sp. MIT 1341]|uniref:DEAD/DEAH box helicase n=1 Tax=Prochlorococcus sp. MIT 1341 TaxID=3096221 RepID=UPI0039BF142D